MERIRFEGKGHRLYWFLIVVMLIGFSTMGAKCLPGKDDDGGSTSPILDFYVSMQTPGKEFNAGDLDDADPKYSTKHTGGGSSADWEWNTTDMSTNTTFIANKSKIQDVTEMKLLISWEHHSLTSTSARKSSAKKAPAAPGSTELAEVETKCDLCHNQEPHAAPPSDPYFCGSACHHGAGGNPTYALDALYMDSLAVGTSINDQAKAAYPGPASLWIDDFRTEKLYLGNPEYPGVAWNKDRRLRLQWYIAHYLNWCGFTAEFHMKGADGSDVLIATGNIPANQRTGTIEVPVSDLAPIKDAIMNKNGLIYSKTKVTIVSGAAGSSGSRRTPYSYPYCVHFGVKIDMKVKSSS